MITEVLKHGGEFKNAEQYLHPSVISQLPPGCEVVRNDAGAVMVDFGDGERVSIHKLIKLEVMQ